MRKHDITGLFVFTLNILFILMFTVYGLAGGKEPIKRFQVEIYGGYAALNPGDLNSIVDYDRNIQEFLYDSQFIYLTNTHQIWSWKRSIQGERKKIKHASPKGLRLKYFFNRSLAVSLCITHFSREESHWPSFTYEQMRLYGERYKENISYSPYSLSVRGLSPLIGLHLVKSLSKSFLLEGFFSGGLLFAQCRYISDWRYSWRLSDTTGIHTASIIEGRLEQQGEGTGFALELGLRLNYRWNTWMGTFLSLGYSLRKVTNISGYGSEEIDKNRQDWQGEWAIKRETLTTPWGYLEQQFPTNYWPSQDDQVDDFQLNLSGFQLRFGFFFRF